MYVRDRKIVLVVFYYFTVEFSFFVFFVFCDEVLRVLFLLSLATENNNTAISVLMMLSRSENN
jgi:hypothetical protein